MFIWMGEMLTGSRSVSPLQWACRQKDQKSPGHDYAGVASMFGVGAWLEALGRREMKGVGHHWSGLVFSDKF